MGDFNAKVGKQTDTPEMTEAMKEVALRQIKSTS